MRTEPILSTGNDTVERLGLRRTLQLGFALFLFYPQLGIHTVAVNRLPMDATLLHQGKGMDDGKKLADVVGTVYRTIVENLCSRLQVDALVFHRSRIARAGCIYSPGIGIHLGGQRQDGIVAPRRRIGWHIAHLLECVSCVTAERLPLFAEKPKCKSKEKIWDEQIFIVRINVYLCITKKRKT